MIYLANCRIIFTQIESNSPHLYSAWNLPASQGVKAAPEVSALSSAASVSSCEAKDDGVLLLEDDGHASSAGSKERSRSGRVLDVRTRSLSYSSAARRSTFLYLTDGEGFVVKQQETKPESHQLSSSPIQPRPSTGRSEGERGRESAREREATSSRSSRLSFSGPSLFPTGPCECEPLLFQVH